MQIHGAGVFTRLRSITPEQDVKSIPRSGRRFDTVWPEDEALANALATRASGPNSSCTDFPIPSGAVYLAQMMVHDMLRSLPTGEQKRPFENAIARPFMLDSVYGTGPGSDAHLYEEDDHSDVRCRFREGHLIPFRDIADLPEGHDLYRLLHAIDDAESHVKQKISTLRNSLETIKGLVGDQDVVLGELESALSISDAVEKVCKRGLRKNGVMKRVECLAGDLRNDSHTIIAQMTATWQRYHNLLFGAAYDWINEDERRQLTPGRLRVKQFLLAQNAVRQTWLRVLENDVLPWIVGPVTSGLADPYQVGAPPPTSAMLALRVLHALPQHFYRLNQQTSLQKLSDILAIGSHAKSIRNMNQTWAIDWDLFFDSATVDYDNPQPGDCAENRAAFELSHAISMIITMDPDAENTGEATAFEIDLMRSRQLLDGTGAPQIPDSFNSKLPDGLNTKEGRKVQVLQVLSAANIDQSTKEGIAEDPPLLLILLMEAAHKDGGNRARLGPLGAALLQPWLSQAIQYQKEALKRSEFAAPKAPNHASFLDIVAVTETS